MQDYVLGGLLMAGKQPGFRTFLLDMYEMTARGSPNMRAQKDELKQYFEERSHEYPLEMGDGLEMLARIAAAIMTCLGVLGGCEKGTAELAEVSKDFRKKEAAFREDNA
jgi:hypothetical protein